jgi:hypothetical protein
MLKGVYLTLLVGPAVPLPVPQVVLEALTSVEVKSAAGERSGFQLQFTLSNNSPLQTLFLLTGGNAIPVLRVVIVATVNSVPNVLMDGVVQHTQIAPGSDSQHSTLTVSGEDISAVMDLIDFSGIPYPSLPPEARVAVIVAKYAFLGIVPFVIPSVLIDIPIPTDCIPRHQGTDYAYVTSLADEVGYVFYIDSGPAPGMSRAYWGPEIKVGVPQPALNINLDSRTNVESLSFSFDAEKKTLPVVWVQIKETKIPIPIPIPDITPLNPPLGAIPTIPKHIEPLGMTANLSPVRAALIGMAKAAKSADAVTANGTLDVTRYGQILKSRQLVGVRGAGTAFDGLYYCRSVTHTMKQGEFKTNFTLARNGLVSTLSQVPA